MKDRNRNDDSIDTKPPIDKYNIGRERVSKSFTMEIATLEKIHEYMDKTGLDNFTQTINELITIGLESQGIEGLEPKQDTGKFDIDIITTGISHTQQSRMRSIIDIIQKLCDASEDGNADRNDIIREAEIDGVESGKVEDAVDRLRRNGQIYEPSHGKYRLSNT